jgi:hypothetical protein
MSRYFLLGQDINIRSYFKLRGIFMENEINGLSIINNLDLSTIHETMKKISQMQALVQNTLKKDHDYGVIPGTKKPTLLKPGAEKICMLFGLTPQYEFLQVIEDYTREFFSYDLKCTLIKNSSPVAQGVGSCNSKEKRYRYITVDKLPEDYIGINEKIEDRYGRIRYKIENPDLYNFVNTVLKIAKKRAFVDAILQVASLSDIFTQDLEDISEFLQKDDESETYNKSEIKLNFGKYKGETLENVFNKDNKYFMWLKGNERTSPEVREACEIIFNKKNSELTNENFKENNTIMQ